MRDRAIGDDVADLAARIERGERILKHHLDALALLAQRLAVDARQVGFTKPHGAAIRLDQAHDQARDGRFAGTGFADQAKRLALKNVEADFLGGLDAAGRLKPAAAADIGFLDTDHLDHLRPIEPGSARRRLQLRYGGEQRPGIGMLRPLQHVVGRALFDHLAVLEHDDAIGDIGDDAEIMGDEHHRHVAAALQVADQFEDLRLRGDVERGRRLVGHQHRRLERQRHRDHRALPLAARELVRIGAHAAFGVGQADFAQQAEGLLLPFFRRQQAVRLEHLGDLVADPHQGVERRHRLLEHHGNAAAAQTEPAIRVEGQQVLAAKA